MLQRIAQSFNSAIASFYWFTTVGRWGVHRVFNSLYDGQSNSETFRGIYRNVFGEEFAEEADPTGFVTMTDLRNLARDLNVGTGQTLVDLACGRGGPGLWVARETGASLVGCDIAKVAVEMARRRIGDFGLTGRAEFRTTDIVATGFPEATFDAAMSIDALFLVPDKPGAFCEAARILKPGARFAFTTWELDEPNRVKDYRPLLERYGFAIETYDECAGWKRRQLGIHEQILANRDKLVSEMGEKSAHVWIRFAEVELPLLPLMSRIYVVARKT